MTEEEVNRLLERFDQTEPALQRRIVAKLLKDNAALRMVHQEARELVGEADATGSIPQANIDALRALLWRASIRGASRG